MEARLRQALHSRSLPVAGEPLRTGPVGTLIAYDSSGRCAFFEPGPRTCAIHRRIGHDALPVSCRLFPRVCLLTPRGVEITLSHYCPTAADLLFGNESALRVVANAERFPRDAHYEGLDARQGPPPLLRPGVWLGWDGYERWQRHVLEVLGRRTLAPEEALRQLADQAERARGWTVERGAFPDFLEEVLAASPQAESASPAADVLDAEVTSAIPSSLRPSWTPAGGEASCEGFEGPILRYLAARAFASWVAIQGPGLRTTVRALQAALVVVRREAARVSGSGARALEASLMKEAFRQADLRLVHLASPEGLAAALGRCETPDA